MKLTRTDFAALFAAVIAFAAWYTWNERAKQNEPADNWFVVRNVAVPDFTEGENPSIVYDRENRQPATIKRNVDIHSADDINADPVCSGRNVKAIGISALPDVNVPLSEFIGAPCTLRAGQYVAEVSWIVTPKGYKPKRATYVSNIFRVLPSGSLPYVPPAQVQQLEKAQELLEQLQ